MKFSFVFTFPVTPKWFINQGGAISCYSVLAFWLSQVSWNLSLSGSKSLACPLLLLPQNFLNISGGFLPLYNAQVAQHAHDICLSHPSYIDIFSILLRTANLSCASRASCAAPIVNGSVKNLDCKKSSASCAPKTSAIMVLSLTLFPANPRLFYR